MSTEQKRKELAESKYMLELHYEDEAFYKILSPDGWVLGNKEQSFDELIDKAYEHLQRDTKLKALEAFVLRVHDIMGDILDKGNSWQEVETYENADDLIKQFNITAADESDSDG